MSSTLVSDAGQPVDLGLPGSERREKPVGDSAQPVDSAPQQPLDPAKESRVSYDSQDAAGVVQSNGQIIKAAPVADSQSLFDYLFYRPSPSSSPARVWSGRQIIYFYRGDEALSGAVNRILDEIRWVQLLSWRNDTALAQQYQISYTTELRIIEGSEVNTGFNLGASYEGMSIGFNNSQRTFTSTETVSSRTITTTVNVPPYTELIFYQKRFQFRDVITFVLDAWGREWNVGPWGGYSPLTTKNTLVRIFAEEYLTTTSPLPAGPGSVQVTNVPAAPIANVTRRREDTTRRCQQALANMGI